jgi:hypothetical protein
VFSQSQYEVECKVYFICPGPSRESRGTGLTVSREFLENRERNFQLLLTVQSIVGKQSQYMLQCKISIDCDSEFVSHWEHCDFHIGFFCVLKVNVLLIGIRTYSSYCDNGQPESNYRSWSFLGLGTFCEFHTG